MQCKLKMKEPIKNPLTIIAVFAGIAEVSGTAVLPFISNSNQIIFIYFLIFFPLILLVLFFLTLNFNHKMLYAPSDYKDEENFIKTFRFNFPMQKQEEVKISEKEIFEHMNKQFEELKSTG